MEGKTEAGVMLLLSVYVTLMRQFLAVCLGTFIIYTRWSGDNTTLGRPNILHGRPIYLCRLAKSERSSITLEKLNLENIQNVTALSAACKLAHFNLTIRAVHQDYALLSPIPGDYLSLRFHSWKPCYMYFDNLSV